MQNSVCTCTDQFFWWKSPLLLSDSQRVWDSKKNYCSQIQRKFFSSTGKPFKCPITLSQGSDTSGGNKISCQILHRKLDQDCFLKSHCKEATQRNSLNFVSVSAELFGISCLFVKMALGESRHPFLSVVNWSRTCWRYQNFWMLKSLILYKMA